MDYIDPNKEFVSALFFRDNCVTSTEGVHIKDLRVVGRDLKDIVLVDNAAYSFG
jgi:CTD small phosphatase-like protein 2